MIIVNFNSIACVPPIPVDVPELKEILRGCEMLLEENTYEELTESLDEWELGLAYCLPDEISAEWYTHALICICLRGLRGEKRPKFTVISPGETK